METTHKVMNISNSDWGRFFGHAAAVMEALQVPEQARYDVVAFVEGLKMDIVE